MRRHRTGPSGGTIADGGSCTSDWQCASGRCSTAINACGICVARIARGDTCDPDHDGCADDLACSVVGANSASYLCTPVVDVGGPCNDGAVCPANTHCGPMSHVCAAVPKLGEACDSMTTFFCDLNGPAAECDLNMCVAGPTPAQRGASCAAADGGTSSVSCLGECLGPADGGSLTCQDFVQGGQSCALGETCAPGLACVNGVCGTCDGSNAPAAAHRTARASAPPPTALTKPGVSLRGRLRPPW